MPIPLFDAHCDTLRRCWLEGKSLRSPEFHAGLSKAEGLSPYVQLYAIFTDRSGWEGYCTMRDIARRELKEPFLLSVEGAEGLDCDPEKLPQVYADGVRAINLCWNYDNALCGAAMDSGRGLTEKGRAFLARMEELGILADMSHISEKAFWDVLEAAKRPVIASHSDSRALRDVPRNLTDEQFRALVQTGGCVGLNYYTGFLGLGEDIGAIVAHAEHFLALGGEKHLGLGSDFDGCDLPFDLQGLQHMDRLYEAMLRRNWPEMLVQDIFYNNFRRLFDEYTDFRTQQML